VIGSLATQVRDRGEKMYIVSNDKDFQQLLEDDKIFLLKPVFNSKEKRWSTMTAEDFRESNHGLDPCKYVPVVGACRIVRTRARNLKPLKERSFVFAADTQIFRPSQGTL